VYYAEAREELQKLFEGKPVLKLTADTYVRQKDCAAALTTLKEVLLIDPKDTEASDKLDAVQALVGTKKCNP
jgi:Tfp pilus assembly protein PilF